MSVIDESLAAWRAYFTENTDWQSMVSDLESKPTGCGDVYEIGNPLNRDNEDAAIADMRNLKISDVHYHANGYEFYIVLQGTGTVVVGGLEEELEPGYVIVTPPNTAHFTIPKQDLVIAAVNVPAFSPDDYLVLTESNKEVGFDQAQYQEWKNQAEA